MINSNQFTYSCELINFFRLYFLVIIPGLPAEFTMYLNYSRGLRFDESPDYLYLRQLFRVLFRTLNHNYDYVFDWSLAKMPIANNWDKDENWIDPAESEKKIQGYDPIIRVNTKN